MEETKPEENSQVVARSTEASDDVVAISAVGEMIRCAVEPLARSQEIAAKEGTNQAKIISEAYTKIAKYGFLFGAGILIIAAIALFQDKEETTLQIMMGLFGVIGGFGISKMIKKP